MRQRLGGLASLSFKARVFLPSGFLCISPAVSVSGSKKAVSNPSPISLGHPESAPCFERTRRGAPSLPHHPRLHNLRQKSPSCSLDDLVTICNLDFDTLDLGLSLGSLLGATCCIVWFMGMFGFPAKRPRDPDGSDDLEDNAIHEKKVWGIEWAGQRLECSFDPQLTSSLATPFPTSADLPECLRRSRLSLCFNASRVLGR